MFDRLHLALLVREFLASERQAIATMHPRDIDCLAEVKQRLADEAQTIATAEGWPEDAILSVVDVEGE